MTDNEPIVEVTVGRLGAGERVIELGPGDEFEGAWDEPSYIRIEVKGEKSDSERYQVGDTTYEQEDSNGNREWKVKAVKCPNCGKRYPKDYSRCENCGIPNPSK